MLDGLFVTPAVTAIREALSAARGEGPVAVVGNAKLATALASHRTVIAVGVAERGAKKLSKVVPDASEIDPASLDALVGVDVTLDLDWPTTLRAWSQLVRDGGLVVFVDRGHAVEASRRALCAGLTELEQRHAGRSVITSGIVTHLVMA